MKKVIIPTNCPSCNSTLIRVKDQLFCKNNNCTATQNKKVLHFIKTMKIKGLGERTIEKLGIETLEDIYLLTDEVIIEVMGNKLGPKLIKEIEESKIVTLEKLLPALSISLIGTTAGRKLNTKVNTIDEITFDICKEVGLGDIASTYLIEWIETEYPAFKVLPLTFEIKASSRIAESRNIKVCITGKLNDYRSRELAASYLREAGITVVSGVSKTLDFLINEDNKPSSKLSKASEYGIPVRTIKQLIEEIK